MIRGAKCAAVALAVMLASTPGGARAGSPLADALTLRFGEGGWHPAAQLEFGPEGALERFAEDLGKGGDSPGDGADSPAVGQRVQVNEAQAAAAAAPSPGQAETAPSSATPGPVDLKMETRTREQTPPDSNRAGVAPAQTPPMSASPDSGMARAEHEATAAPDDALVNKATRPRVVDATIAVPVRSAKEEREDAIRASEAASLQRRLAAAAANQTRVVETIDINRLRLECPRQPCPAQGRCAYKNGVCCGSGKHCCPHGSTCVATDPPTCTSEQLDGTEACREEACAAGLMCPHKGVYLCCLGGRSCCANGFQCDVDGRCQKIDSGVELQRRFEDMQQARAAIRPRNADERTKVQRTTRQGQAFEDRLQPSNSPIIRIVTARNTLPPGWETAGQPAASNGSASAAASSGSGGSASGSSSDEAGGDSSSSSSAAASSDGDEDGDSSSDEHLGADGLPETPQARAIRLQAEQEGRHDELVAKTEARIEESREKKAADGQRKGAAAAAAATANARAKAEAARRKDLGDREASAKATARAQVAAKEAAQAKAAAAVWRRDDVKVPGLVSTNKAVVTTARGEATVANVVGDTKARVGVSFEAQLLSNTRYRLRVKGRASRAFLACPWVGPEGGGITSDTLWDCSKTTSLRTARGEVSAEFKTGAAGTYTLGVLATGTRARDAVEVTSVAVDRFG